MYVNRSTHIGSNVSNVELWPMRSITTLTTCNYWQAHAAPAGRAGVLNDTINESINR